jgi:hypothetical protein
MEPSNAECDMYNTLQKGQNAPKAIHSTPNIFPNDHKRFRNATVSLIYAMQSESKKAA